MVIATSVVLNEHYRPYLTVVGNRGFVISMLSLTTLAHVSSRFKIGTSWTPLYTAIGVVLFAVPLIAMATGTAWEMSRVDAHLGHFISARSKVARARTKLSAVRALSTNTRQLRSPMQNTIIGEHSTESSGTMATTSGAPRRSGKQQQQ